MSLDIYLFEEKEEICRCCGKKYYAREELFEANITHNLNRMADKAGIYEYLWHQKESKIVFACQLIPPLTIGIKKMKKEPEYFKQFDAVNKWGTYDQFIPWIERLIAACEANQMAIVKTSV